jgi:hypothetical protein
MKRFATMCWQHLVIALLATVAVVTPVVITTACTPAQVTTVITDITKFSPVVTNVLVLACDFTPGAVLCSTGAAILNKSIADLTSALTTYEAKVTAGTATSSDWNILNAVFSTFEADSANIFDLFRISNAGSEATANAVATGAQTLLSVIEALFPSAPVPVVVAAMMAEAVQPRQARYAASLPAGGAAAFNLSAWEKDYNKRVDAAKKAHPKAKLSHVHSKML